MLPPKSSICAQSPKLCRKMKSIRTSPWPGGVHIKREKLKSSPSLPRFKDQLRTTDEIAHNLVPNALHRQMWRAERCTLGWNQWSGKSSGTRQSWNIKTSYMHPNSPRETLESGSGHQCIAMDLTTGNVGLMSQPSCLEATLFFMSWNSQDIFTLYERKQFKLALRKQWYILIHIYPFIIFFF